MSMPTLSLIIPVFDEQENLPVLIKRLQDIAREIANETSEFVFVDDGSGDNSFGILKAFSENDSRIKALRLSRNFGSHHACLAGLQYAQGERTIIMAADLQDPPELVPQLLRAQTSKIEVVWGIRKQREESWQILFFANLYHQIMRFLVSRDWPGEGADVVLLTRKVRDMLLNWPEKNTSLFAQIFWLGLPQSQVFYIKGKRHAGRSKWNFSKRLKLGLDSIVSFSFLPIRLISYAGILISMSGFLYALLIIFLRVFQITQVPGWSSLMIVFLLTSGFQLMMLGVIGEYLWRSADQVKNRPFFVVAETLGLHPGSPSRALRSPVGESVD